MPAQAGNTVQCLKTSCPILCENECIGPRQGNNAAQLSKPMPMTAGMVE